MAKEPGFTQIPHEILEHFMKIHLSSNQWQVLLCIFRKTYGYHKKVDYIANNQIGEATGLGKTVVSRVLHNLNDMRLISRKGKYIGVQEDWGKWLKQSTLGSKLAEQSTSEKLAVSSTELAEQSIKVSSPRVTQNIIDTITKDKGVETTPPKKTRAKSKPFQIEAGIFLDLVEEREDSKIINRGKAIKAIRAILTNYPEITPEKLYQCFAWLRDNDSFLHSKEPPAIISFMPDKFPAWLAGKLQGIGGERYGRQSGRGVRPKPRQERAKPITYIRGSGEPGPEDTEDMP